MVGHSLFARRRFKQRNGGFAPPTLPSEIQVSGNISTKGSPGIAQGLKCTCDRLFSDGSGISREIRPPSWMRRGPVLALEKRAGHRLVLRENANHERPKPLLRSDWTIYRGGAVFVKRQPADSHRGLRHSRAGLIDMMATGSHGPVRVPANSFSSNRPSTRSAR